MIVTRFNPSANGPLHLGHIMTLLVNERFAHENGGKCYLRFDDNSPNIAAMNKKMVDRIMDGHLEVIDWLGIRVDGITYQSQLETDVAKRLLILGHEINYDDRYPKLPLFIRHIGTTWLPFPHVPQQTAERVVMDAMLNVTHVIRGEEFATEYSQYLSYCDKFKIDRPEFVFLPRLMCRDGDISKTSGGNTIVELRAKGYDPVYVLDALKRACLLLPANGWNFYNLKRDPCIDL